MTTTNEWPNPARLGVPPQDGVYWLKHNVVGDKQPCLYEKGRWYCCGSDIGLSPMRCAARYSYIAPVLTPDEAEALQKRVAKLEEQNDMLRHANDKLRAMLTELNARHEPLQRAFITAVELLNDAASTGGKDG